MFSGKGNETMISKKDIFQKLLFFVLVTVLLAGCGKSQTENKPKLEKKQYQASFLTLFDTVTTILGYAETEEEFEKITDDIYIELEKYHKLFDIYNEYEMNNIKTINEQAGVAPVEVDKEIIELLLDCKEYYRITGGKVNVAMGSVLSLWHEARENGVDNPLEAALPDEEALREAALHCNIEDVVIDEEASTVYIVDPKLRLDVGAVAKGWATEKVCQIAPEGLLVSVGGNVRATGPKPEEISWVVGIQSPWGDNSEYVHTLYVNRESVVTSGDYQRYYTVDGEIYHHLIDPKTLYPGKQWKAVSVVCEDSGLADALSTALFLLSKEEGEKIVKQHNAVAMWIASKEEIYYSDGFEKIIKR